MALQPTRVRALAAHGRATPGGDAGRAAVRARLARVQGRQQAVELREGRRFVDRVKNVVTAAGEDFAEFEDHARVPVAQIAD